MYVIIDIETTGGKFNEEGVTEIAMHRFDGHSIVDSFVSLINPEKNIQPFVVKLTGISNKMVKTAPKFHEVAKRIIEISKDAILVAHNSDFDYRILKNSFKELGYDYERNTLCTVELSRKLLPEEPAYSLGKLCKSLGIPMSDRHRANGDALATVKLFEILLEKDNQKEILIQTVQSNLSEDIKPKLDRLLDPIPRSRGIYYLHRSDGQILYLAKSGNIKKAINNLFVKQSKRAKVLQQMVTSISYDLTGNILITNLKCNQELLTLKPKFNKKLKPVHKFEEFNNPNMLIVDKGREIEQKGVVYIEDGEIIGYCFVELAQQLSNPEKLKNNLTLIEDTPAARLVVKNYLDDYQPLKIIRFGEEKSTLEG
ncbi:exonuclease domain-containing protein [Flavobacteriaceae bacterium]|nr:exonuclease domain-containing protein [Flavobacteriaceae bacterium]